MKKITRVVLGWIMILVSLIMYIPIMLLVLIMTIVGWTTDNPAMHSGLELIWLRIMPLVFLFLNSLLLYSGIKICRDTYNRTSAVFLGIGLIPTLYFLYEYLR